MVVLRASPGGRAQGGRGPIEDAGLVVLGRRPPAPRIEPPAGISLVRVADAGNDRELARLLDIPGVSPNMAEGGMTPLMAAIRKRHEVGAARC